MDAVTPVAPRTQKAKRQLPIPKTSAAFFRARGKQPMAFGFTPEGNLAVPEMRGEPATVLELPRYRPATAEEKIEKEDDLRAQISVVEREYDETAVLLKDAMAVWRATGAASEALRYQRKMTELDSKRTLLRSPMRWVYMYKGLAIKDVLLEKVFEEKKLPYPVAALRIRNLDWKDTVRVRIDGETEGEIVAAVPAVEEVDEEVFVFFNDPADTEHGALSPETMVEFIYNSTKYTSLVQAYETERVTALNRPDLRPQILKTRSPKMIRMIASKVVGDVEKPIDLWVSILKTLVDQHPRVARVLRETETDTLAYANPKDTKWGIGLTSDDLLSVSKENWLGENWLGQAWQAVREGLPADTATGTGDADEEEETQAGGGYKESSVTETEQKQKRSHVLMGMYRRKA
jgi:predicted NAD-dependent protein-ADP-ribosyltransferase YbiA (DUF1768 family)